MIKVYPFASGSLYTASYAVTASYSSTATFLIGSISASTAEFVVNPESGSRGMPDICYIRYDQYLLLVSGSGSLREDCSTLPPR